MSQKHTGIRRHSTGSVVIVGAGPGGLASAMLLAKGGLDVTVIEKRGTVGGRTSTMEVDGFKFDVGPTFFLYPQVLREIFSACGCSLEKEVPMFRLDPQYRLVFGGGGQVDATSDVERMKKQIAAISPADAARLEDYFRDNREKLRRFMPILQTHFESWRDLMRPEILRMLPLVRPWRSLDSDLRKYFHDDRIRLGFSFQSKYLGMSPFSCPSLFSILSFLEYEHGVFHPVGGCGAVTKAMARIAEGMGVRILRNTAVEEMLFEGRAVVGVRTPQEIIQADAVVVSRSRFRWNLSILRRASRLRRRRVPPAKPRRGSCHRATSATAGRIVRSSTRAHITNGNRRPRPRQLPRRWPSAMSRPASSSLRRVPASRAAPRWRMPPSPGACGEFLARPMSLVRVGC